MVFSIKHSYGPLYIYRKNVYFFFENHVILANSADPGEMAHYHYTAFHLGLHYMFAKVRILGFSVYKVF